MLSYKGLLAEQGVLLDEMADRHVEVQKSIDAAVIKEQSQMISRSMSEIYNQANTWFVKYASNEGISVSEAKKRAAAADIETLSKKAAAYSAYRHDKEFAFSEQANREMALFNLTMKTSRAELQLREMQLSLIKLNDNLSVSTFNHLYSNTEAELVRLAGIMGKSVLTGSNIASMTETIVNGKGQYGTNFRDTIWNNISGAQKVLEVGIRQSLIQGKNPKAWASSLKGFVDQTQLFLDKKIETIAITETAMRQDEARKLIAKRAGFTFYRIRTERDSRRCEICARFDEYIGSYKDLAEGVNAPLFHARCRCQADPYEYTEAQNDKDFAALEDYVNRLRAANSIEQVKEELYGYDPVAWLGASAPKFEMTNFIKTNDIPYSGIKVQAFDPDEYEPLTKEEIIENMKAFYGGADIDHYDMPEEYQDYVGNINSRYMNEFLYSGRYEDIKSGKVSPERRDEFKINQVEAFKDYIDKAPNLHKNTKLVRFVDEGALEGMVNLVVENPEVTNKITRAIKGALGGQEDKAVARKEFTSHVANSRFEADSFISTSYDIENNLFKHKEYQLEIYADKGANALMTYNHKESDVVLNVGSILELKDIEFKGGKVIVKMRAYAMDKKFTD